MSVHPIRRVLSTVTIAAVAALALGGCAGSSSTPADGSKVDSSPLKIYATAVPQGDVLKQVQKLADEDGSGLKLEVTTSATESVDPNAQLVGGDFDANFYQHQPYFNSWVAKHPDTDLVNKATVLVNVFGLYSEKHSDASDLPDGATVLVPNEQTNLPRALFLLQDLGLLKLNVASADGSAAALGVSEQSIVDNPKHLNLVATASVQRAKSLPDVDASFVNGDIALSNGINPNDALKLESADDNPYANVLTTTAGKADDPRIKLLTEYLTGDEIATFIKDTYQGFVQPSQKVLGN
ncbi:MetQ/NlpA family ABC transporter substrate-binding protein [Pseudoclavibacter sp. CFCC 13611]|uniref:MetQ/NlpA family ABC transporter substrate-binding protein n=1 Tax=Pseudoclavibacter sp. CFCC 13611 TaxID=2615178 RepID=UPI001300E302|nr:MetQ/NlpA family ABC transporter substrate-binding protein [Pseudoclavibacter sp. CFCC 13611]KAB1664005.1 ABC transporter substrate-binding protein [Pseudoclavibacter sp. CFCC 13611]